MRNSLLTALLLAAAPALAELPPLIDRDLFFGDPEIAGAQISPDGRFIAFIKPFKGTRNVWVKETKKPFDSARPLTADMKRPIPGFFWSRDGRYILFVQDQAGDENYNVFSVDPAAQAPEGKEVPDARDLTGVKKARTFIYDVPRSDPDAIYIGINDRDPAWHDLYKVRISTGAKTLLRKNEGRFTGWHFDHQGKLRLATRSADNGDTEVLRIDEKGFSKIYGCSVLEYCGAVAFDKEDRRVYLESNRGDRDLTQLVLLDPASGKEELVESDPEKRVDFGTAFFSEVTRELVMTSYTDEKVRRYFREPSWKADYEFLRNKLPGKDIGLGSMTRDEQLLLFSAHGDTEPGETWLFDRKSKELTQQYRVREKLAREHLAPMKPIRYPSSDGLSIPAYLTLPNGVPVKSLPLLIVPHGGPWARSNWGYNSFAQFFANRGYAVLQPNFRGSIGYGKKFIDAGNGQWGEKMQDDLTWGVKHLVAQGIADPKRVGIMGGSYGGYATLAGVTFTPDVYAAAVAIVAPSNLITLLESIPPYWEAIRKMFHVRMGDPKTPEGKAQLERQSPVNSAHRIKTPLLVVQGANDPRVNKHESDQIVVALRDRGFPVGYIVAPDEGHGLARPVNNLATFASAEKFFATHLKGRHQEGMTAEVAARLKEITVDPKTVVLKKKFDAAKVELPKPESDLAPLSAKYAQKIEMGGRTVEMKVTREVKEEDGAWVVIDTATSPMGEVQDRTTVEKSTLLTLKRSVKQGPVTIDVAYGGGRAKGTIVMGGAPRPIDAELGGPLFGDGSAEGEVIAHLPLAEGYSATLRQFDLQRGKQALKELKVVGAESVTVPAGTFAAHKVEVASVDGPGRQTLWIDKESRKVVKTTATMPMGNAKVTAELLE